jgi:hypothetical protein
LPTDLPTIRTIEIRRPEAGPISGAFPWDCDGICVDLLAAGVLDSVTFRYDDGGRTISRVASSTFPKAASGLASLDPDCPGSVFHHKEGLRETRLLIAGYCIVSSKAERAAFDEYSADVTFVVTDDTKSERFKLQQLQAFDASGEKLLQQSHIRWHAPNEESAKSMLSFLYSMSGPTSKEAGSPVERLSWRLIVELLGLDHESLKDLAITYPPDVDPATIDPPDVHLYILENLAASGIMTPSERLAYVARLLQPSFHVSEDTATAILNVLRAKPEYGRLVATAIEQSILREIRNGDSRMRDETRNALLVIRRRVPPEDLPSTTARFEPKAFQHPETAMFWFADAASMGTIEPLKLFGPLLDSAVRTARGPRRTATPPEVMVRESLALNTTICRHAAALQPLAEQWLFWFSAHAADYPEVQPYASQFGITAAKLGIDPGDLVEALRTTANWTEDQTAGLKQDANAECPMQ